MKQIFLVFAILYTTSIRLNAQNLLDNTVDAIQNVAQYFKVKKSSTLYKKEF
jgi:hypothetical protein